MAYFLKLTPDVRPELPSLVNIDMVREVKNAEGGMSELVFGKGDSIVVKESPAAIIAAMRDNERVEAIGT